MSYQPGIYRKQGGNELVIKSTGDITMESSGNSLKRYLLSLDIADLSADTTHYLVVPWAGTIKKIWSIIDGAVSSADATITARIGTTAITNGAITVTSAASAAGDVDSCTPTALNVVAAGDALNFVVAGGGAGGSPRCHVVVEIERT